MEQCVIVRPSIIRRGLKRLRLGTGLFLFLLATVINAQASTYSESVKFDLKMNNVSLKEVFQTITEQREFKFIYNNNIVDDKLIVTVKSENARFEEILKYVKAPEHPNLKYFVFVE